jgi:hypothetical protein
VSAAVPFNALPPAPGSRALPAEPNTPLTGAGTVGVVATVVPFPATVITPGDVEPVVPVPPPTDVPVPLLPDPDDPLLPEPDGVAAAD